MACWLFSFRYRTGGAGVVKNHSVHHQRIALIFVIVKTPYRKIDNENVSEESAGNLGEGSLKKREK